MDPKVRALRDFRLLLLVDLAAGDITEAQAVAGLHMYCDKLWPPAVIRTRYGPRMANP